MRHILVTGAAGGLGACVCDLLAASGDTVFAADADSRALQRLEGRGGIVPLRMDVTAGAAVSRARRRIAALADGLDGLVCCAGIFTAGALVETGEDEMARLLDVNVMGAFRVVRAFFPLLEQRHGTVVLIGSESSRCAMPFNGPYTVSKCALQAYADALRRELMFVGMRVVVIQPGAIRTPLLAGARSSIGAAHAPTLFPAQRDLVRRMLLREWEKGMEPGDVADVVVRALHARRPKAVYRVGNDPSRAMLASLPATWVDGLVRAWVRISAAPRRSRARRGACASPPRGAGPTRSP
jgi:NAD(P)-dependent dehydrogenase (short-subunit alcohol dehydrogenase family)